MAGTTTLTTANGPIKAIHIQVPVGIPTPDGGLEIPNRIFLGGIPTETTELELELFFSDFGLVKDVRIVTDRITGESKGYGFVTYEETEDISGMLRKKTILMKGKKLRVRKAVRRNGSQFQPSDSGLGSSGSSDNLSPVGASIPHSGTKSNGEVFFVPQSMHQELPPIGNYHPLPIHNTPVPIQHSLPAVHQTCPVTSSFPYQQPQQQQMPQSFHPVYCYPVGNPAPMNFPPHTYIPHQQPYIGVPVYSQM